MLKLIKFVNDRLTKGYAQRDTWSLDTYLATIIKDAVLDIKSRQIGYPNDIEPNDWDQILINISIGFTSYLEMNECGYYDEEKGLFTEWTKEDYAILQSRYNKGMKLFAKHFSSLWD